MPSAARSGTAIRWWMVPSWAGGWPRSCTRRFVSCPHRSSSKMRASRRRSAASARSKRVAVPGRRREDEETAERRERVVVAAELRWRAGGGNSGARERAPAERIPPDRRHGPHQGAAGVAEETAAAEDTDSVRFTNRDVLSASAITLADVAAAKAERTKGEAENPHGVEEMKAKFLGLTSDVWGEERARAVYAGVMSLREIEDVRAFTTVHPI